MFVVVVIIVLDRWCTGFDFTTSRYAIGHRPICKPQPCVKYGMQLPRGGSHNRLPFTTPHLSLLQVGCDSHSFAAAELVVMGSCTSGADAHTLRGGRAGGAPNECRLRFGSCSLSPRSVPLPVATPQARQRLWPRKPHPRLRPWQPSRLRFVDKGSQDHSAHPERFRLLSVNICLLRCPYVARPPRPLPRALPPRPPRPLPCAD